jgi:hypothetical protein
MDLREIYSMYCDDIHNLEIMDCQPRQTKTILYLLDGEGSPHRSVGCAGLICSNLWCCVWFLLHFGFRHINKKIAALQRSPNLLFSSCDVWLIESHAHIAFALNVSLQRSFNRRGRSRLYRVLRLALYG